MFKAWTRLSDLSITHSPTIPISNGEVREKQQINRTTFSFYFDLEHAEADTFYCFTNLMTHIRDNFMKIYDNSEFGIHVRMQNFLKLLKKVDNEIYDRFETQKLKPEFYAFRWLTLLLSQEFYLPDVLRLWDSLFADQERNFEFLLYICCAMVVYVDSLIETLLFFFSFLFILFCRLQREHLLNESESHNIKLLQVCVRIRMFFRAFLSFRITLQTRMYIKSYRKQLN